MKLNGITHFHNSSLTKDCFGILETKNGIYSIYAKENGNNKIGSYNADHQSPVLVVIKIGTNVDCWSSLKKPKAYFKSQTKRLSFQKLSSQY